jgi:hypothetical protein
LESVSVAAFFAEVTAQIHEVLLEPVGVFAGAGEASAGFVGGRPRFAFAGFGFQVCSVGLS